MIHVIACICANCVYQDPETKQCNKVKKHYYQKTADEETCAEFKCRAPWAIGANGAHGTHYWDILTEDDILGTGYGDSDDAYAGLAVPADDDLARTAALEEMMKAGA